MTWFQMNGSSVPCAVGWAEVISRLEQVGESRVASFPCLGGHAGLSSDTDKAFHVTSLLSFSLWVTEYLTWWFRAPKSTKMEAPRPSKVLGFLTHTLSSLPHSLVKEKSRSQPRLTGIVHRELSAEINYSMLFLKKMEKNRKL